jgi:cation diffusion facilitator CzcD-associated flavoprotein CzcO
MSRSPNHIDAVIVGAGFAGLYQLYKFRALGMTCRVFEKGPEVGGTWYWNRYPGARCDVESMWYSYSFSPELEQEWKWTEKYPPQREILRYLKHVADRFDLRKDITFNTTVVSAEWDEYTKRWSVRTSAGETVIAQFVVMATGCLSVPKVPDIPGVDRYRGQMYHTADWPHEGADFSGKRIAVIGTGSSGIQSIPILAEQARRTTVFQRTPVFSLPARNRLLAEDEIAERKANYRFRNAQARVSGFGIPLEAPTKSALEVTAQERDAAYRAGWDAGSLVKILSSYTDLMTDVTANDTAAEFVRNEIRQIVDNPGVAETLCPTTFPIGAKRPCLDTDYYATFNKVSVRLVDLRKSPIVEVTEKGVRTTDEQFEFDAIILATGFDAMTGALNAIDIMGRRGIKLAEKWKAGPRSYLGLSIAEFPNLFTITGPSSPSVLTNMVYSIERHVDYVSDIVRYLRDEGYQAITATIAAEDEWVAHVDELANATVYPLADSWYIGANVPGKPRVFMAYPAGVQAYLDHCDEIIAKGYEGFELSNAQ